MDNMTTTFKCPYCDKEHQNPYLHKDFERYYQGLAHYKETGDILIWHRYDDWIRPEQGAGFPGPDYTTHKIVTPNGTLYEGDYWWHGGGDDHVNEWVKIIGEMEVHGGTIYARRKE